jgi:hypothetical protein
MYIISIGNHAMAMGLIVQVMFGNLYSQNWTSRREQHRMITCLLLAYDKIGYFSVNIIISRQSPVLPAKFGAFVRIFI